jgi:hypothetical protein
MDDRSPMPLARFRALLDAYGASPDRWPAEERDAARALLARSPQAQRWRDASAQLDALLDLAPAGAAAPALVERILAAVPEHQTPASAPVRRLASRPVSADVTRRGARRSRAWRYAGAALPLAAAAVLVLWLLTESPRVPERSTVSLAEIGTYDTPTDVLLDIPSVDALDRVPAFGCTGAGLGCLDSGVQNNRSQSALDSETYV